MESNSVMQQSVRLLTLVLGMLAHAAIADVIVVEEEILIGGWVSATASAGVSSPGLTGGEVSGDLVIPFLVAGHHVIFHDPQSPPGNNVNITALFDGAVEFNSGSGPLHITSNAGTAIGRDAVGELVLSGPGLTYHELTNVEAGVRTGLLNGRDRTTGLNYGTVLEESRGLGTIRVRGGASLQVDDLLALGLNEVINGSPGNPLPAEGNLLISGEGSTVKAAQLLLRNGDIQTGPGTLLQTGFLTLAGTGKKIFEGNVEASGFTEIFGGNASFSGDLAGGSDITIADANVVFEGSVRTGDAGLGFVRLASGASLKVTGKGNVKSKSFFAGPGSVITIEGPETSWDTTTGGFTAGSFGEAELYLRDGARVTTGGPFGVGGDGIIENTGTSVTSLNFSASSGTLNIMDGAAVYASEAVDIRGVVNLDAALLTTDGRFEVGHNDPGQTAKFNITNGAILNSTFGVIGRGGFPLGPTIAGLVSVEGPGSRWENSRDILVGRYGKEGTLIVADEGVVETDNLIIWELGTLTGDGTIIGDVSVVGGNIDPGRSPGLMSIDGALSMSGGKIKIEITGLETGEYDLIEVLGDVSLDSTEIIFSFDDFLPTIGDSIDFLSAGSLLTLNNVNFLYEGLADEFVFDVSPIFGEHGSLVFTALSNGKSIGNPTSKVPEPTTLALLGLGVAGLCFSRRRKISRYNWIGSRTQL